MANAICSIDGCEGSVLARGWCRAHYYRWYRRGGDPAIKHNRWKLSPMERFNDKWVVDGDCWIWVAAINRVTGYGYFAPDGSMMRYAHRVAYEWFKGPIPQGLQIDHLCFRRNCVNPDHLEAVTSAENNRRARERSND